MTTNNAAVQKKISQAKLVLMTQRKTTFLATLLASMKLIITEEIPIAATDGTSILLNPAFVENIPKEQLLGLLLHEVFHTVFEHIERATEKKLDHTTYNIAGDHYINLYLTGLGYKIPPEGYCDIKYKGWSTQKIYNDLIKNPPPNKASFVLDILPTPPGKDPKEHQENILNNILKAVTQAKLGNDPGSIPGSILRRLDDLINPKLPWNIILQNYMTAYRKEDYSWKRPNRRYMPEFYLPYTCSEGIDQITVGVDVSGSMSRQDLTAVFSEIQYIWDTLQPKKIRLQTFDTIVHMNKIFHQGELLEDLKLTGGGGTNVSPLIDSIRLETPELALIFTDGHFTPPSMKNLHTDIFWIIKGNQKFTNPIGEILHFN